MNKLLAVAVAGVAIGILIAPGKARSILRKISSSLSGMEDSLNHLVDRATGKLEQTASQIDSKLHHMVE
jgi:proteasome assembly chaperone (PAC2) family protein